MARKTIQIPGLQANSEYVVQLRGIDDDGNPGRWSTQFRFESIIDEMPPAQVENLEVEVEGPHFNIKWDPVTTNEDGTDLDDLRDYVVIIHAQDSQGNDIDDVTYHTVDTSLNFTYSLNVAAFGGFGQPRIKAVVRARDRVGNLSIPAEDTAVNDPPGSFTVTAVAKRNAV